MQQHLCCKHWQSLSSNVRWRIYVFFDLWNLHSLSRLSKSISLNQSSSVMKFFSNQDFSCQITGVQKYLENAVQAEGIVRLSWEQAGFHSAFAQFNCPLWNWEKSKQISWRLYLAAVHHFCLTKRVQKTRNYSAIYQWRYFTLLRLCLALLFFISILLTSNLNIFCQITGVRK